jgi:hypothetical protein
MANADNSKYFENHPYIKEVELLNTTHEDRVAFHKAVEPVLMKMGQDEEFLKEVAKRNFTDKGFLDFEWSYYNIPFFYVYEKEDFVLKVHLFPAGPEGSQDVAAHCIHHHNNYILTTYAFYGSGYESMLFDKDVKIDEQTLKADMKISKHFHQKDWNPSRIDSWTPHLVFLPESLSATMVMWTPDKKRKTDGLRNNPILKPFKKELRHLIYRLGISDKLGISREKTYQFYVNQGEVHGIEEDEYFAPTRAAKGPDVREYCLQMLFSFIQRAEMMDAALIDSVLADSDLPEHYKPWLLKLKSGERIADVFHRTEINIPNKTYYRKDVQAVCQ